jgi:hypothetical protein
MVLFLGLLCEEIGSHLEEHFDRRRDRMNGTHKANWHKYLRLAFHLEPVGQHYLRTVLLRLKFELGSMTACGFALLGIWWLPIHWKTRLLWSGLALVLGAFLCYEAWASHQLLGEIREDLLGDITEIPVPATRSTVPPSAANA